MLVFKNDEIKHRETNYWSRSNKLYVVTSPNTEDITVFWQKNCISI